jgi:hypothetical protein
MTTTLEIIRGGITYDLSDRARYLHKGNSGFGMAPVKRWTEQGAAQHGATDRGFLLQPRTIQLALWLLASDEQTYFERRNELMEIFAPSVDPIKLRLTAGGSVRQIDCFFVGDLALPSSERTAYIHRLGVTLQAPDPTWYDPTSVAVSFGLAAGANVMNVPLAIPWNVGTSTIDQTVMVAYSGTWLTHPTITITGPITNPIVENVTTGELLDFTGITIASGDTYTIDTRYGLKTVTNAAGTNKIAELTDASDLSTFHIAASNEVPGGVNDLRVTGTGATQATQAYIAYVTRYVGI